MADNFCRFVIHWPVDQSDKLVRCDRPAGLKIGDAYYCAEHYDWHMERPDVYQIGFTIIEN